MMTHNFVLPHLLDTHLESNGYEVSERELLRLKSILTFIDSPRPRLWGFQQIDSEHGLWKSDSALHYMGTKTKDHPLGQIDPNQILIIGEADEDSPLALDYRSDKPRVVYLGEIDRQPVWIELAPTYEAFIRLLQE